MSASQTPEPNSLARLLASLPQSTRARVLESLTETEAAAALHLWEMWARPNQLPPDGDWATWLILAGRGFGKTRTGAEWIRMQAERGPVRIALVGATAADVRDVMVEGESGILACSPPDFMPEYEPSKRRLTWPNGAIATTYSADKPRQLRGPQHHFAWADELAAWRYPDAWDQLQLGLRLGDNPRCVVTTTPRIRDFLRAILEEESTHVTRGSTYENRDNLPKKYFAKIVRRFEGTRLGEQELKGELLDVMAGAVYADFSEAEHVIDWESDERRGVLLGWDFGITKPSVLIAEDSGSFARRIGDRWIPPRSLVLVGEVQEDGVPTQRLIPIVARALGGSTELVPHGMNGEMWHRYIPGRYVEGIYCDPAGDARDQATGERSVEMLRFAFGNVIRYETTQSERDVASGIERVQLALRPGAVEDEREPWRGQPELYFDRSLVGTRERRERRGIIAAMKGYSYPEAKPGQPTRNLPQKDGEYDHAADALRYTLVNHQNASGDGSHRMPLRIQYGAA